MIRLFALLLLSGLVGTLIFYFYRSMREVYFATKPCDYMSGEQVCGQRSAGRFHQPNEHFGEFFCAKHLYELEATTPEGMEKLRRSLREWVE